MIPNPEQDDVGVLASARRLGSSALGLLRTRLGIFSVELQEEKLRVVRLLVWLCAALLLTATGFLVAVATLAVFLWEWSGYAGLLVLAGVLLVTGGAVFWTLRRRLLQEPRPFAETTAEFQKDVAWLRPIE